MIAGEGEITDEDMSEYTAPPSLDHIGQIVRRLLDAVSVSASREKFETGPNGKLATELLTCFEVDGVIEAFINELTLAPVKEVSEDMPGTPTPPTFRFGSSATFNYCNQEAQMGSREEKDRVVKVGQILVSALLGDSLAMALFEKIIISTRPDNIIRPRLEKISAMQLVEVNVNVVTLNEPESVLSNAVEIMSRIVEASTAMDKLDILYNGFVDPANITATEQMELLFKVLQSGCREREENRGRSGASARHREVVSVTPSQFQACLSMVHVLAIKSSGRCPLLPTLVDMIDKPNLRIIKEKSLSLVGDYCDVLWGPDSLLFGEGDGSPLESLVTTTNRVTVLELMVESMFYFIVSAKKFPEKDEARDSFMDSIPWRRLFDLLWSKYRNASIYQSLLYKMVYMVLGSQHEDTIRILCSSGEAEKKTALIDSIVLKSTERQGYYRLLILAVEKFSSMFAESILAKHVAENTGWKQAWLDCIGTEEKVARKEDEVLVHVLQ
ncbi:UNVERIFIED_CONTAM: hypothetical protein HDU68_008210, partial [Siphonaria sp. JEL0065]